MKSARLINVILPERLQNALSGKARVAIDFHSDVHQLLVNAQLILEVLRLRTVGSHEPDDARKLSFAHAPDMQVADLRADRPVLDGFTNLARHRRIELGIEQHTTGVTQ